MPEIYRNGYNYGAALPAGGSAGQVLMKLSGQDGDTVWGDAKGVFFAYIVGSTPFAADWLAGSPNGSAFNPPNPDLLYLILTAGDYYNLIVRFNNSLATPAYEAVSSAGSGGGVTVCYTRNNQAALSKNWLSEEPGGSGAALKPKDGNLYLVKSSGDYLNCLFEFDESLDSGNGLYVYVHDKQAYEHSQKTTGNPHEVTKSDVGLGDVVNTGDSPTPVANGTTKFTTGGAYEELNKKQDLLQFSSMPAAAAGYENRIVQFVGATAGNYVNGYYYKCVNNSGTYSWVNTDVQDRKQVYSGSTKMAARDSIGFVDFGVTDDSLNNKTVVKPHELSDTEWLQIFKESPVPLQNVTLGDDLQLSSSKVLSTKAGIISVETGKGLNLSGAGVLSASKYHEYLTTAKLIGKWIDGKDLYEVVITGTTINSTSGTIQTGIQNASEAFLESFHVSNGTYRKNLLDSVAIANAGGNIYMVADTDSLFKNKSFVAVIRYTVSA